MLVVRRQQDSDRIGHKLTESFQAALNNLARLDLSRAGLLNWMASPFRVRAHPKATASTVKRQPILSERAA